jgi:hypothetical protein
MTVEQAPPLHLMGWLDAPGRHAVAATLGPPLARVAPHLMGADQDVFLYRAWKDVLGSYPAYPAQQIGDCTSFGSGHATDLLQCVEIAIGHEPEAYKEVCTEAIYGMGREIAGMLGGGDGCFGAAVAKAVMKGVAPREAVGPYSGRRAQEWGARGTPADVQAKAAEHPVKATAMVTTLDELDAALGNGYPVIVCSDQGFTMTRDADGLCQPRGSWAHCVLPGTLVSTMVPKPIEDLQIGDEVVSHDGKMHHVSETYVRDYNGDVVTISCWGNTDVRYTDEHPLYVLRAGADSPDWISARSVRVGDELLAPKVEFPYDAEVPAWDRSSGPNQPSDIPSCDRSLAWMFGYYVANGNRRLNHGVAFTIPAAKGPIADRIVDIFGSLGLKARIRDAGSYRRVAVDSVTVERTFRDWFGEDSSSKRIPTFLLTGRMLESTLKGLYDGDGGARSNGEVYFDTISPTLARQVWMAQVSLGRHPSMRPTRADRPGAYENAKPGFRVRYVASPKKQPNTRFVAGFYAMPVRSILKTAYVGKVYNCEVEGTHSYLADGVVSHNCMAFVGRRTRGGKRQYLIANSWGDEAFQGPTTDDQPLFSFWADGGVCEQRMLSMRDSFAFSGFQGWPGRPLPSAWTYEEYI